MFDPNASRKDVMYGFATEDGLSEELLKKYQYAYPEFADDLLTLYHELLRPEPDMPEDWEPSAEDTAMIEAAWKRHAAAMQPDPELPVEYRWMRVRAYAYDRGNPHYMLTSRPVKSEDGQWMVEAIPFPVEKNERGWYFCSDLTPGEPALSPAYRLATLEAEREQIRRLLAEARPVLAKAKELPSPDDMKRFWYEGSHEGPWVEYADEYIDLLPALLALIEQIEGLSRE